MEGMGLLFRQRIRYRRGLWMKTGLIVSVYILSVVLANLSASYFGIWITPINAFLLIGLEITVRDLLHERINHLQMIGIVLVAGILSYSINIDTQNIAIASLIAVTVSCLLDYAVFKRTKGSWLKKSNTSNVFSSASDSLLFPTIGFGTFNVGVVLLQFFLKLFGGFIWSLAINKFRNKF